MEAPLDHRWLFRQAAGNQVATLQRFATLAILEAGARQF